MSTVASQHFDANVEARTEVDQRAGQSPPTLYLIDGHAQFFRAYYAIRTPMSSPTTGEPTNLTHSFFITLFKMLRAKQPSHLAVVIDVSGDTESFRSEIYPQYKAHRDPPPQDLPLQVDRCVEILKLMGVPVIGQEGVEADDVIATIARRMRREHPDMHVRIVSKDKDLTQLVGEHVDMYDPQKDAVVTPGDVFKTEGVQPEHVIDILALMGDAVDNVPGVPGIGPKTAAKLVLEHGSAEQLLANIGSIKGKRRENLEAHREQIPMARELVTLRDDLDVIFDLDQAAFKPEAMPGDALFDAFTALGLNSAQSSIARLMGIETDSPAPSGRGLPLRASPTKDKGENEAPSLFTPSSDDSEPETSPDAALAALGDYQPVMSLEALDALIERIDSASQFAFDTETDGLAPVSANLCGVSIAIEPGHAHYIPTLSPEPERHLDAHQVIERLRPVLESNSITKIAHNLKFDLNVLRTHDVELSGPFEDTMIESFVLDTSRTTHKLDALSIEHLGHPCIPITELIGRGKSQVTFDCVPLDQAVVYAAEDADVALRLHEKLRDRVRSDGLEELYVSLEMPLVEVLARMEYHGIRVDPDELQRQEENLVKRIDTLRDEIADASPHPFNPDSPKQLAAALFNDADADPPGLGLKPIRKGKTGPSTDQSVLEELARKAGDVTTVPDLILEYRQLRKLVSTYLVALREAINDKTGRVHTSLHQTGAATGRLSSSDPNLQNIPIRTEVGREIRRAFVADPGNVLLTADYSQIELRMLAHLSEDPALIAAFEAGADIHTAVAAEVYGVEPDDVTTEQRGSAKMVNFGIVYGITAHGLAARLGPTVSRTDAQQVIDNYKRRFDRIDAFLERCKHEAIENGYVATILGRRRPIPQIRDRNQSVRALGERMAINSVVQGSAADLIKRAMLDLHRTLPKAHPNVRMILQIHDELVFECPETIVADVRNFVVDAMESAMKLRVPLVVDAAWSANWIDAK